MNATERLTVKAGLHTYTRKMTRQQAHRLGERSMPRDLKRAGFETVVARSDSDTRGCDGGGTWFRINYGKKV